jgi:hypothetical protein
MGYESAMSGQSSQRRRVFPNDAWARLERIVCLETDEWVPVQFAVNEYRKFNGTSMSNAWIRREIISRTTNPVLPKILQTHKVKNKFVVSKKAIVEMESWMWECSSDFPV